MNITKIATVSILSVLLSTTAGMAARDIDITGGATSNTSTSGGNPNTYTATGDNANIQDTDITTDLDANTDVVITTGATGMQNGDIQFSNSVQAGGASTADFTINAAGSVSVDDSIDISTNTGNFDITIGTDFTTVNKTDVITANGNNIFDVGNDLSLVSQSGIGIGTTGNIDITTGNDLILDTTGNITNGGTGSITLDIGRNLQYLNGSNAIVVTANNLLDIDIGGDLLVDANGGSIASFGAADVDVVGDVTINGTFTIGSANGSLDLNGTNMTATQTSFAANNGGDITLNFTNDITLTNSNFGASGSGLFIDDLNFVVGNDLDVDATNTLDNNNTGDYNFNIGGTGSFAPVLDGSGGLTKTGAGSLNLTGVNTYTGETTVTTGTLFVNGSTTSNTVIGASGTLGGTGTVTGSITNNGTLAAGNSIGTLNQTGNFVQNSGGTFEVEVDDGGNSDLLAVTGSAAVDGTLEIQAAAGNYNTPINYTILTATGGVTGTFDTVNIVFGGGSLSQSLTYNTNDIMLSLFISAFSDLGNTPGQQSMGDLLQRAVTAGEITTIRSAVSGLSGTAQLKALDDLGAMTFGTENMIIRRAQTQTLSTISNRIRNRNNNINTNRTPSALSMMSGDAQSLNNAMAPAAGNMASILPNIDGVWSEVFAGAGSFHESEYVAGGFAMGIDKNLTAIPDTLVGAAFSFTQNDAELNATTDADTKTYQLSLYGEKDLGKLKIDAIAGLSYSQHDSTRGITVGALTDTAFADYESYGYSAYAEAQYDVSEHLPYADQSGIQLDLISALGFQHHTTDSFRETGGGAFNLSIDDASTNSLLSTIGFETSKTFTTTNETKVTPAFYLGWTHEYLDDQSSVRGQFVSAPTSGRFAMDGARADRDSLSFGTSVNMNKGDFDFYTAYRGNHSGHQNDHMVTLGFKMRL